AREPVGDDRRRLDAAALREVLAQALGGGGVGKTADIQLGRHRMPPRPHRPGSDTSAPYTHAPETRKQPSEARPGRSATVAQIRQTKKSIPDELPIVSCRLSLAPARWGGSGGPGGRGPGSDPERSEAQAADEAADDAHALVDGTGHLADRGGAAGPVRE